MWNVPAQAVVDYADVHEMVTAVTFSLDGSKACVGTMKGKCRFYRCDDKRKLEYEAQIGDMSSCRCLLADSNVTSRKGALVHGSAHGGPCSRPARPAGLAVCSQRCLALAWPILLLAVDKALCCLSAGHHLPQLLFAFCECARRKLTCEVLCQM